MTALSVPAYVYARLRAVFGPLVEVTATRGWFFDRASFSVQARAHGSTFRYSVTVTPGDDETVEAVWLNMVRWAESKRLPRCEEDDDDARP